MAKEKKGLMPKFEVLIILVFLGGFLIWGATKCNSSPHREVANPAVETPIDTPRQQVVSAVDTVLKTNPMDSVVAALKKQMEAANQQTPKVATPAATGSRLYVTIEGLKLRKQPSLQGDLLGTLKLYQEVTFMNEVTDTTSQINLGAGTADEPWVKIKTARGTTGWVYGAGVNYYRKANDLAQ